MLLTGHGCHSQRIWLCQDDVQGRKFALRLFLAPHILTPHNCEADRGCLMIRVSANTYSKSKYASVIREVGGWEYFQKLLSALDGIARKHSVDIATVSSRWVLDQPQV